MLKENVTIADELGPVPKPDGSERRQMKRARLSQRQHHLALDRPRLPRKP